MSQIAVHTTKPFMTGRCQAIRIPKEYRLPEEELIVNMVGESLVITPKASLKDVFYSGLADLPDDLLREGRPNESENERLVL